MLCFDKLHITTKFKYSTIKNQLDQPSSLYSDHDNLSGLEKLSFTSAILLGSSELDETD